MEKRWSRPRGQLPLRGASPSTGNWFAKPIVSVAVDLIVGNGYRVRSTIELTKGDIVLAASAEKAPRQTRIGLCGHSNRSPFATRNSARKEFGEAGDVARISHRNMRIGSPNQRKSLCRNDFTQVRGAPDADRVYHAIT
jgi:hypothetical protein